MELVREVNNEIKSYEPFHKSKESKERVVTPFEEVSLKPGGVSGKISGAEVGVLKGEDVDSVSISREAKVAYEFERIVRIVRETPDVRQERLEELREKLRDGSLVMKRVIEVVAERLRERLMGSEEARRIEILTHPESTANAIADWLVG